MSDGPRHRFAPHVPWRELDPAAEVDRLRRQAAARWLAVNQAPWTVDQLLTRAAEVGDDRAAAEAIDDRNRGRCLDNSPDVGDIVEDKRTRQLSQRQDRGARRGQGRGSEELKRHGEQNQGP